VAVLSSLARPYSECCASGFARFGACRGNAPGKNAFRLGKPSLAVTDHLVQVRHPALGRNEIKPHPGLPSTPAVA
jgi:hypothetical protein